MIAVLRGERASNEGVQFDKMLVRGCKMDKQSKRKWDASKSSNNEELGGMAGCHMLSHAPV